MEPNEPRRIDVERENPLWQEYDREIAITLWHNKNQATVLRLSPAEADALLQLLQAYRG